MAKEKDPRYKSGEHHYGPDDDDSSKESLEQLSTIGAVGAEIRSVRREMKLEFRHFGKRFDDALESIRVIAAGHQEVSTEHAGHIVRLNGLENRMRDVEESGRIPVKAGEGSGGSRMKIAAKNTTIPWLIAGLLALVIVMAALTGRRTDDLIPRHTTSPDAPAVNVNLKQ